jgi:TolB-like protein
MIYRFNDFSLDTSQFHLTLSGNPVSMEPLVLDLLVYLIEHCDRVVTRDELFENLWKGKIVTDAALGARIKDARRAVGDSGNKQSVIKTIHGRGYQFVARLHESVNIIETLIEESDFLSLPDKPSIAVLPFVNLSNDPEQDYFSDGITDDIITALSKIKNLLVIAKSSTSVYQNELPDLYQVGREQGVRYVLQGRVRKGGHRIRVTVQLIEASTSELVWADSYDRELEDIFVVQDEIMREVVVALDVQLIEGEQARAWSSGTKNFEAWECVRLSVTDAYSGNPSVKLRAKQLLEKALKIDPSYAIA